MDKKKERVGQSIKIKKYEDIFDNNEGAAQVVMPNDTGAVYVSPSVLRDFKNHPFRIDSKGIDELMESIREHGILSPIIVRPIKGFMEQYEIISGHRRRRCAEELGLETVPVIIRDIDDDEAVLAMVDSNIQREDILPSEKAFAYKMKLEAIKRQGERRDLSVAEYEQADNLDSEVTCGQVVHKLKSADIVGKENNESGRQIRRYIRLTELPETLRGAVDSKKMSFNAGVELSYLSEDEKKAVENASAEMYKFPTLRQAKKIRELSTSGADVCVESVVAVLMERKEVELKGNEEDNKDKEMLVNFERQEIRDFFPRGYTARQIEDEVIQILRERVGLEYKS